MLSNFPSSSPSFLLQIFHVVIKIWCHLRFLFIWCLLCKSNWRLENLHNNGVQTTNAKDEFMHKSKMKKIKCEGGWKLCCAWDAKARDTKEGCKRFVFKMQKKSQQWSSCKSIIYHPLFRIDKLSTLVGTKMYIFARFYICNLSLSFHNMDCW
jgi:hypothetical protein